MNRLIDEYLTERHEAGELAESSIGVVRSVLRCWVRHVDGAMPLDWDEEHLHAFVRDQRVEPNTRKSRLTKLRPWILWLLDLGFVDRDITAKERTPKIPKGLPRDFTPEEVSLLLAACPDERAVLIVELMVQMGLRDSDVARIRVTDIDMRRRFLHVRAKGGRGGETHSVWIPGEAWTALIRYLAATEIKRGPLIRSQQDPTLGVSGQHIGKIVTEWMYEAGIKDAAYDGRTPHALRHTCAEHMLDEGADMRHVQATLGHKSMRTTEIYTRRPARGLAEAMEGRRYLHVVPPVIDLRDLG